MAATSGTDTMSTHDLIVVGSGAGGLTGALTAAKAGLDVLVLEKADRVGGMTAYAGGCMWFPGNSVTAAANPADSADGGFAYLHGLAGDSSPEEMQRAYVYTGAELVDYLQESAEIRFQYQPFPDYFDAEGRVPGGRGVFAAPIARAELGDLAELIRPPMPTDRFGLPMNLDELTGGQALIARLMFALRKYPRTNVHTSSALSDLLVEDGRVVGVEVTSRGHVGHHHARRGVLLAAGGFEANQDMRSQWQGKRETSWSAAPSTHTGDAITAGVRIGAATARMNESWWAPMLAHPGNLSSFVVGFQAGIFVNGTGRRFANECLPYGRMGSRILELEDAGEPVLPIWWIFDGRFVDVPCAIVDPHDANEFRDAGLWHTATSIGDLADLIGVPGDALAECVVRFNGFAASGVDGDFGRGEDEYDRFFTLPGDQPNPCLIPIDRPPYHAVQLGLGDIGTKGGLLTDVHGRVLHRDGLPIAGLYATGNTTASSTGNVYAGPGAPIGTSMVFGYRAARDAVGSDPVEVGISP